MDASDRHSLRASLGPFTIVDLEIGWSPTVVGKLFGRLRLPFQVPGFLFISVLVLKRRAVLGSYQLS